MKTDEKTLLLNGIKSFHTLVWAFFVLCIVAIPLAARYTTDRRDNFDIFLPVWLARHNKTIFGWLFAAGVVYTVVRWFRGSD